MAFDLTFEESGEGHLLCHYRGSLELGELIAAAQAVYAEVGRRSVRSTAVDLSRAEDTELSVPDRYRLLNWMATHRSWDTRVAVVMRPDQGLPGDRWKAAAAERGVPVRVFTRLAAALAWLREEDVRSAPGGPA